MCRHTFAATLVAVFVALGGCASTRQLESPRSAPSDHPASLVATPAAPNAPAAATAPESEGFDWQLRWGDPKGPKPRLSGLRIGGEVGAYALAGAVGAAPAGAYLFSVGALETTRAGIGAVVGVALVGPLGVYAVGNLGDETGSLGWTYVGALGGAAVAAVLGGPLAYRASSWGPVGGEASYRERVYGLPAVIVVGGALIAGPIIGFNYSRKYDAEPGTEPDDRDPFGDDASVAAAGIGIVPTLSFTPEVSTFGASGRF